MEKVNRKQLNNNIIKFVIGLFLLIISMIYLQEHPAEKRSRDTGAKVVVDRVQTFFEKLSGTYDPIVDYKTSMIQNYKEILYIAESTSCLSEDMKTELDDTYKDLSDSNLDHFKEYKDNYYLVWSQYRSFIEANCQ